MSIGAGAIGENSIAAQQSATLTPTKVPPPKRTTVVINDTVAQPEPR